ncbi:MAG: fumarylacetoacetate hydrolase family protein [Pseudomonadota bacterium]
MKLLRFGPEGEEKPGLLDADGHLRDLSGVAADFGGDGVALPALDALRALAPASLPIVESPGRIGACLSYVPNFFAVGLNYKEHAAELSAPPPEEPILFSKSASSLSGPYDALTLPRSSEKADWEVELGIVIGRTAHYVSEEDAPGYVAGYCIVNDVSERAFQLEHGGQWSKGKSAPGFGPVGPWLVTPDEIEDVQNLALSTRLNDDVMQSSSTSDMIFPVAQIISYMSQFMELRPGDLIATGTPPGIGMGKMPQRFLRAGDVLDLEIAGLGAQRTEILPSA